MLVRIRSCLRLHVNHGSRITEAANPVRGFTLIRGLVVLLCLASGPTLQSAPAYAGDPNIREIERLLWVLGYGANRLDGLASADLHERSAKFLSDRGKDPSIEGDQLLAELNAALQAKRVEVESVSSTSEVIDRRPLTDIYSDEVRMVISPDDDVVLAGSCKAINRFRLSSSAPLKEFDGTCLGGSFVFSHSLDLIAYTSRWSDGIEGLILSEAKSGLLSDFIEIPEDVLFSKIAISPDGNEVGVLTNKNFWRVNLTTHVVTKFSEQLPATVTGGAWFSPGGRFVAAAWSKKVGSNFNDNLRIWDLSTGKSLADYPATAVVFSNDDKKIALQYDLGTVEIRDTATGRSLLKRKFQGSNPDFSGYKATTAAFSPSTESLMYVDGEGIFREWSFGSDEIRDLFHLAAPPERAVLDLQSDKLYTISGSRVVTYDIPGGGTDTVETGKLEPLSPTQAALSPNKQSVALASSGAITIVDTGTGAANAVPIANLAKISSIAFLSDSERLLVGTEDGKILTINVKSADQKDVASVGQHEIKVVVAANARPVAAVATENQIIVLDVGSGKVLTSTKCNCNRVTNNNVAFVDNDQRLLFPDDFKAVVLDIGSGRRVLERELKSNVKTQGSRTTWMHAWVGFVVPKGTRSQSYWVGGASMGSDILYEYDNGALNPRRGSPEGQISFFPAGSDVASVAEDGALEVVLFKAPKLSRPDDDKFASQHLELRDDPLVIGALAGDRFVTADKSGEVRFYSRSQHDPVARTLVYADGNWLSRTAAGFFAGTRAATNNLFLTLGTKDSKPLESFFDALYRPDLVREVLAGDPAGKEKESTAKLDLFKITASGSVPKVAITSPANGSTSTGDETTVEAAISDQGGGIGKVEWRINGVTLGVDTPAQPSAAEHVLTVRRTFAMDNGENHVEVLAYNAQNLVASEPSQVTVKVGDPQASLLPKLHVLVVGVNNYWDSRLQLAFADADATALGEAFRQAGQQLYRDVDLITVLDKDATAANLDRIFTELGQHVKPSDVFVYFMAGHGKTVDGRFYFIPQDFRYQGEASIVSQGIGQDELQQWLARIPAQKSVLLFDACESGSLTEEGAARRGMEQMTAIDRLTHAMGRTVLTATTDDKPAAEGLNGHGVFTYALLKAFGEAPTDSDGLIEVTELASYVDHAVPELSYSAFNIRQVPQMKIVGSNFPIARRVAIIENSDVPSATPLSPTHVVIATTEVRQSASDSGSVVTELTPGIQVRVISNTDDWALVARSGNQLGYVDLKALAPLQ